MRKNFARQNRDNAERNRLGRTSCFIGVWLMGAHPAIDTGAPEEVGRCQP